MSCAVALLRFATVPLSFRAESYIRFAGYKLGPLRLAAGSRPPTSLASVGTWMVFGMRGTGIIGAAVRLRVVCCIGSADLFMRKSLRILFKNFEGRASACFSVHCNADCVLAIAAASVLTSAALAVSGDASAPTRAETVAIGVRVDSINDARADLRRQSGPEADRARRLIMRVGYPGRTAMQSERAPGGGADRSESVWDERSGF